MQRQAKKVTKPKKLNDNLRNNTTFGQLIENLMKKFDAKVANTRKQYLKWSFTPDFKRGKQFPNGAKAIESKNCRINLNKSFYI